LNDHNESAMTAKWKCGYLTCCAVYRNCCHGPITLPPILGKCQNNFLVIGTIGFLETYYTNMPFSSHGNLSQSLVRTNSFQIPVARAYSWLNPISACATQAFLRTATMHKAPRYLADTHVLTFILQPRAYVNATLGESMTLLLLW